jgi:hypothetical protein
MCWEFGLINSTVQKICKKKQNKKQFWKPERSDVNEALLKWFKPERDDMLFLNFISKLMYFSAYAWMEIYNYRRVIFIISKLQLQFQFEMS